MPSAIRAAASASRATFELSWGREFDQPFGAHDEQARAWRPEVYDALIPAEDRPAP